jgi:GT2 family glycosyltransferase
VIPPDPLVDVVVVTWNTRELTLRSLTNLMGATTTATVRLLVHDNGSSDETAAAIARAFPDADVVTSPVNLGFAAGVNAAIARSTAPWLLLLNSDAWPEAGAIDSMLAVAQRRPRAAIVAPQLRRPDGGLEHSTWPIPSLRSAVSSALRPTRYVWSHDRETEVGWAVAAAWLVRREAVTAIGPLDERLFMYAEDLDWCWRAREAGWEIWFTPDAVVRHVGNASGEQRFGGGRAGAWINNSIRVYRKRHSAAASLAWQAVNAVGAARSARRARRVGDTALAATWRAQAAAWLRRPSDDTPASSA